MPFQQPGYAPAGTGGPTPPNDAQKMIQDLLTRPRVAGTPGQTATPQAQTIGGGIAGIASTADAEGIKIYNEHTNYKEWEFNYDPSKDRGPAGAPAGNIGTPASDLGTPAGQQPGQTSPGMPGQNSPFGQPPGAPSPGFGAPGFGAPGFGTPTPPPRQ
jgi:hypothetical protein